MSAAPLRYRSEIEAVDPDEQATIESIIAGMTGQSEVVEKREGHAVRASHAKSSACVTGELVIPDLPPELAQGLFAKPGRYPVAVRFAQGPGETLGDRVSTHRGMSIKIFGAEGERLPGHDAPVQDFVLATGTTFPSGTAQGFLRDGTVISGAAGAPELLKSAVSSAARNFNRVLHAFGAGSDKADFFGHPFSHPLADSYFSQTALRWGDHVAKLGAVPASPAQAALADWRLDPHQDEDGFRHAAVAAFADHDIVFELRAQLWTDAEGQPIEDASVDWPVAQSPYRTIGTIRLPRQNAYSPERVRFFDEVMIFRPAHSLAAHRPLGSVNRARLQVYRALSAFRHRENNVAERNPASIDEIPRATADRTLRAGTARPDSRLVPGRFAAVSALAAIGAALAVGAAVRSRRGVRLREEARFDHQVTGVAVAADGRRFVNFPRWTDDAPISVAEIMPDGGLRPYPNARWNAWRNARATELAVGEHFVCVQSIVPDGHGNLWVLDPGAPGNERIVEGAPKLVRVDLATDRVTKVIPVPGDVALQGTYLNDIRFSPDGRIGYITDSGARGAIIVVDLETGASHRALDGHPSTQPEGDIVVEIDGRPLRRPDGRQPFFAADGIAISADGRTLYWQALTGRTLYAIDTDLLRASVSEPERAGGVRKVAETCVADGLWMSRAGVLYVTSPTDSSIKRLNGDRLDLVLTDRRLRWPDTFAEGPDGRIFVTASRIQDTNWFKATAPASLPTHLFSFDPAPAPQGPRP